MHELFRELSLVLAVAAGVGMIGVLLRQPLIVAFIAAGILIGPTGLDLMTMGEELELLATIGISVLLFVVGLKLDLEVIRTTGPVALATGLGQVLFTSVFGFLLCLAMGIAPVPALYVAVALTFSSTIIIVKLLSDKREIDSLHGRIAVGFLIVQDVVVVLAMIVLSAFGGAEEAAEVAIAARLFMVLGKGLLFLGSVALLMRFVLPRLVTLVARSQELLVLFAVAWAVALAAVGEQLGFSREVGAFLAGVSLASTPYREALSGRLVSLRDFLLLFFFLHLGATLDLGALGGQMGRAGVLSLFVLVGNPLIVLAIMGALGYRKRTSFLAGLTVAQISEFSLILAALGLSLGHLDREIQGLVTLVGLVTIGLSTYLILYSHPLYERLAPLLGIFERRVPRREIAGEVAPAPGAEVVLFGVGRYGSNIARALERHGTRVLGVDFDPRVIAQWRSEGRPACYGDATDPECPAALPLAGTRWIVCTAPDLDANLTLAGALRGLHYAGKLALTARGGEDETPLRRAGADLVLYPFLDAAERAAAALRGLERPAQ